MFCFLETEFRIDNLLLLDLEVFIEVIELVVECDESGPFLIKLVFSSLVVILTVSRCCATLRREMYLLYTHRLLESS
jgi:hypothetical protein